MNRYVCVHGHFYHPPRQNPWLEEVELEDSAAPFHDWNDRITAECYRPNAWSRVLDDRGYIERILNNYSRISFNVGPTLASWLERHAPDVYEAVREADRQSVERFSGHGSALAQPYHHVILPLASRRSKETQVAWGVRDFTARFGRPPEGMWLPETAVDVETLEVLAGAGLRFTVLDRHLALRVRPRGSSEWTTPAPGSLETQRPYEIGLPSGRRFALFFYDGALSHDIAFQGLLHNGSVFADRLAGAFDERRATEPQLVHVATDGETYGHHHRHGDMALAFALDRLDSRSDLKLTNYGEFLARYPPTFEAELRAPSSWSCAHGVDRWRLDCGCNSGGHPGWNQAWRTPLRAALDGLRDTVIPLVDQRLARLFADPVSARHGYVGLFSDRSEGRVAGFLAQHAHGPPEGPGAEEALRLLEIERQLEQMYTSCGWFFDELSGIETVQILKYAARALQLAETTFGTSFEAEFLDRLAPARSNLPEHGDGRAVFERFVGPGRIGLRNVCAHFALSSLFEEYPDTTAVYCYTVTGSERRTFSAGTARLAIGQAEVRSSVTHESERFTYGALYIGGHGLFGGVRPFQGEEPFRSTARELVEAFERGDLPETVRRVDRHFGEGTYTLRLLFRDEQRKIVNLMLEATREGVETSFRRIYESTAPILRNLASSGSAAPGPLRAAAEFFLNEEIREALDRSPPDVERVSERIRELGRLNFAVDAASVGYAWARAAERLMDRYTIEPRDPTPLAPLCRLIELARQQSVDVDFSAVQNRYYALLHGERSELAPSGSNGASDRPAEFRTLGEALRISGS